MKRRSILVWLAAALSAAPGAAAAPDLGTDAQRESGKKLYAKYCAQCHGDEGDGAGYAAPHLRPAPRDFTKGKFKIRTTPNGALPTTQDLVNIIRRGMPYSSMPAWPRLTDEQLRDLAYHIKSYSDEFEKTEAAPEPVPLPDPPPTTEERTAAGRKVYDDAGCVGCHGELGRGDGSSGPTLVDDWSHPIRPADLTQSWTFRGGGSRADIFRTISTGLNGTPMPSYLEALKPEERWALTDYVHSLSRPGGPGYSNLLFVRHVDEPIDLAKGAAAFESAPVARFAVVGQIAEPGRSFHPPATEVAVQAICDADAIAFLVRWNDMSAETTGSNSPTLPVPPSEEVTGTSGGGADPGAGAADDPWGDADAPEGAVPSEEADVWGEEPEGAPPGTSGGAGFSDAVALQLPATLPAGARKPYFIFGDAQNPVDLWFFDLARTEPSQFVGKGSADLAPNETGELTGVARYDRGEWSVLFRRDLRSTSGVSFTPGGFVPVAFSVWDGHARERGNRRGLTAWYHVYVAPQVEESRTGPMLRAALLVLGAELAAVVWIRRRNKGSASPTGG